MGAKLAALEAAVNPVCVGPVVGLGAQDSGRRKDVGDADVPVGSQVLNLLSDTVGTV